MLLSIASLLTPMPSVPQQVTPRATVQSPHGNLNMSCTNCHTETAWKPIRSMPEFDHSKTRYPLRGMHASVDCVQCHTSMVFSNVGMKCADCHADFHHGQFGTNCAQCHTVNGWRVSIASIQEHQNRFPLVGAHATLQCEDCHKQAAAGRFQGLSTDCYSCHAKQFQTASLDHRALGFPPTCETCHSMDSWVGAKFDHARFTGFALTGMHATLDCTACHINGKFKGTPVDCYSCHLKDFNQTNNPNHAQAGFPHDCSTCHTTAGWSGAKFDHTAFTKFPLTGMHATLQCTACHVNGRFQGTPADCYSCHAADFNRTTNPNHVQAGFSHDCSTCHSTAGWSGANFNHASVFPLTGAHATLACAACHVNNNFTSVGTTCVSCHLKDYNGTTNPNHKASGFPTDCATCHTTSGWSPATFNHASVFPLTGAHATVACAACHVNNNFTSVGTTCVSCHLNDYNGTTNPNHKASGFPTDCATCHTTSGWSPATFNHASVFPLTGAHATVACAACHVNNNFTSVGTTCVSCHLKDYNGTTNPNHKASGFPTDCSICHSTSGWSPSSFNHASVFPLTGAHATLACATCHVNNNFTSVGTTCVSCHQNDYNGTTNPNHKSAGFPTDCAVCHTTTAWQPATFDHSTTGFPLTGAHASLACTSCHVGGQFTGTPTDCYSCHKTDYTNTTNPNHAASQFPTTCATCHTTTTWAGATFNHTWFPIYSGTHAGKWTTCADCHVNSSNYAVFSCITCHVHDSASVTPEHRNVGGFVYSATSCYTCHPSGRAD